MSSPLKILPFILLVSLFFLPPSTLLATGCGHSLSILESLHVWRDLSFFADSQNALFLADKLYQYPDQGLAANVVSRYPNVKAVVTGISIQKPTQLGKVNYHPMDNTKRFPFEDDSFDKIVMGHGLCYCEPMTNTVCGGIAMEAPAMANFFSEVYRVLDKSHPNAAAYLEGSTNNHEGTVSVMEEGLKQVQKKQPWLRYEIVTYKERFTAKTKFKGIKIYPAFPKTK